MKNRLRISDVYKFKVIIEGIKFNTSCSVSTDKIPIIVYRNYEKCYLEIQEDKSKIFVTVKDEKLPELLLLIWNFLFLMVGSIN